MTCSLAAHIVVSSSSSHIRCWHFWYLRARPRDHYSPFAGMHTQFSSEGFLAMPCTARSDRTSFIIIIRTQDTYTHKILNIISRNNFWFFNVEFFRIRLRTRVPVYDAHCCVHTSIRLPWCDFFCFDFWFFHSNCCIWSWNCSYTVVCIHVISVDNLRVLPLERMKIDTMQLLGTFEMFEMTVYLGLSNQLSILKWWCNMHRWPRCTNLYSLFW